MFVSLKPAHLTVFAGRLCEQEKKNEVSGEQQDQTDRIPSRARTLINFPPRLHRLLFRGSLVRVFVFFSFVVFLGMPVCPAVGSYFLMSEWLLEMKTTTESIGYDMKLLLGRYLLLFFAVAVRLVGKNSRTFVVLLPCFVCAVHFRAG